MKCLFCGAYFSTVTRKKDFCSLKCAQAYQEELEAKRLSKTLADWCREADECNLDYGNYRALIGAGKTFEELKANADKRGIRYYSHGKIHSTH